MIDKARWVYYKSNLYGKGLDVIDTILNEIGADKRPMSELSKYSVAHLTQLCSKKLTWSPSIVLHILLRQVVSNDIEAVCFKEGKQAFHFGLEEFCLLSGLKGISEDEFEITNNDKLIEIYFLEMASPKMKRRGIKRE